MVAAIKGYRLILTMPESMSIERRKIMKALAAEIVLTAREKGMAGCIEKANELLQENPNSWMPMQFNNPANVTVHRETTAQEILADFPDGLDYLIPGVVLVDNPRCAKCLKPDFPTCSVCRTLKSRFIAGKKKAACIQGGAGFNSCVLNKQWTHNR